MRADERGWERGYDEHALEQQRRLARLTLREKIAWLEEAQRVADHLVRDRGRGELPSEGSEETTP